MSVVIETRCGRLRGVRLRSFEGYDYCAFKGVPFAKPPVGELRFRDPLPAEPWPGVREATNFGPPCCQKDFITRSIQGSDDCLYLNVYVRNVNPKNRLPVMVWIHGGAFMYGSADDLLYGPDYLLRKDIVLVTCNYRVGVLGFLNFNDEVAPGNQGLKDQVMALRWVQENIVNFGGDKDNVTIFGESAGGVSVHYLALSKMAKGLFHKAISQSGTICNMWTRTRNTSAYRICEALGNKSKNPKELVQFLRTIDCKKLIRAQEKIKTRDEKLGGVIHFGPGIDNKSLEPLMPIDPLKAVEEGVHVPYIVGCNTREGIFILSGLKPEDYENMDQNFESYLQSVTTTELLQRNRISPNELRRFYFGDEKICEKNIDKLADALSDFHFIGGIHKAVAAQVKGSSAPTYFYRFTFDKEFSITKAFANTSMPGTSHFDEVQYLFSISLYDVMNIERLKQDTVGYRIMNQMTEMWTNFAKYGKPTPFTSDLIPTYWLPVTNEKVFQTLNINEKLRMESTLSIDERFSLRQNIKNKL